MRLPLAAQTAVGRPLFARGSSLAVHVSRTARHLRPFRPRGCKATKVALVT